MNKIIKSRTDVSIINNLDDLSLVRLSCVNKKCRRTVYSIGEGVKRRLLNYLVQVAGEKAESITKKVFEEINNNWQYSSDGKITMPETDIWKEEVVQQQNVSLRTLVWNGKHQDLLKDILSICGKKVLAECRNAAMLARIAIICNVLGEKTASNWIKKVVDNQLCNSKVMSRLSWDFVRQVESSKTIFAIPFVNLPNYLYFKPKGPDANFNLIGLSNGTYLGFAEDFKEKSLSYDEVEQFLYDRFINKDHVASDKKVEHQKFIENMSLEGFSNVRRQYQQKASSKVYEFNLEDMVKEVFYLLKK